MLWRILAPKAAGKRDAFKLAKKAARRGARTDRVQVRQDGRTDRVQERQFGRTDRTSIRVDGRNERAANGQSNAGDVLAFGAASLMDGAGQFGAGLAGGNAGVTVKPDTDQWILVGGGVAALAVIAILATR